MVFFAIQDLIILIDFDQHSFVRGNCVIPVAKDFSEKPMLDLSGIVVEILNFKVIKTIKEDDIDTVNRISQVSNLIYCIVDF